MRVLFILTAPQTTVILRGKLACLKARGFEPIICSAPGNELRQTAEMDKIEYYEVPMQRDISFLQDIVSLWRLYRLVRKIKPTIVVAGTPKAGLLGMLAGFFYRVPIRVGVIHGIRFETLLGIKRRIVWMADKIAAMCSHRILCVSSSVKRKMSDSGMAELNRIHVPAHGSANGLDSSRFQINSETIRQSLAICQKYNIPPGVPIIGFVGRIVRDKGIIELVESFKKILAMKPETRLVIVGPKETGDSVPKEFTEWLVSHPQVILAGESQNVVPYFNLFDVFVLPSYREGFGVVILEAAAMGVPTVGFNATGVVDAIADGETGMIVPMKDSVALADAILKYLNDPALKAKHGMAGRKRVVRDFQPPMLWEAYYQEYCELLRQKNIPVPAPEIEPEPLVTIDPEEDIKEFVKWYAVREILLKNADISDVSQRLNVDEAEIRNWVEQC